MTLNLRTSVSLHQTCSVCELSIHEDDRQETVVDVALFGAVPYAVCPGCNIAVNATTMRDPEYRRRARVTAFQRTGRVLPTGIEDQPDPSKPRRRFN